MDKNEYENNKSEIITKFFQRPKVQIYFNLLLNNSNIQQEWIDVIKGIGEEVKEDLSELFDLFGIEPVYVYSDLNINHSSWWYDLFPLLTDDLDFYLPIFFYEFSLYPIQFMRKLKLKKVYLANSLNFATDTYSQYRAGIPDYCYDTMAMVYCCKERGLDYIKNVIHHELFHFFDYWQGGGNIYSPDAKWTCLNVPDFKYGSGGAMNREWKPLDPSCRGFLNYYSTTGMEEDKAEIFAHIMVKILELEYSQCEILNGKFIFIKNLLNSYEESFDNDFWNWLKFTRENFILNIS